MIQIFCICLDSQNPFVWIIYRYRTDLRRKYCFGDAKGNGTPPTLIWMQHLLCLCETVTGEKKNEGKLTQQQKCAIPLGDAKSSER